MAKMRKPYKRKPLAQRFWAKVEKRGANECWLWVGGLNKAGYGIVSAGGRTANGAARLLAHRVSYEIANGPIPSGLCICHRCDIPACVNPDHLFLGTLADNTADMDAKGRRGAVKGATHPRAKLTAEQVIAIRAASGTQREIGRAFNVSQNAVWAIQTGKVWKSVPVQR